MLVVTDLSKLEKYGFMCSNFNNIYEKVLYSDKWGDISLLVNSIDNNVDNEITVYATTSQECEFDECAPLDILFDMIKDGVVIKK